MKNSVAHICRFLALFILVLSMNGCVNDDSFFPNEDNSMIVSSTNVVRLLINFDEGNSFPSENDQCFRFVYPLVLGYNTDSSITIQSYEGLIDVISSQQINFNITGLQFPIQIIFHDSGNTETVSNESELEDVLSTCEFDTIRDEFDQFFNECFKFDYPVRLRSSEGSEVSLSSNDEFQNFYTAQGNEYQPDFVFPIIVLIGPNFESRSINTYFEFYNILNNCGRLCPELSFVSDSVNVYNLSYVFVADFPGIDTLSSYDWFIDGEFVESDGVNNQGDNRLFREFSSPGVYEVCIKSETDVCQEGVEFCKRIEVVAICPDLFFESIQEQGTFLYNFTADFPDNSVVNYEWYVDGQLVEQDGGPNGDNIYTTDNLSIGTHTVCIKSETPSCPNGVAFCKEIVVEPICPDLFFEYEQEPGTPSYNFTADFEGIASTTYDWIVNGDVIESDGGELGDNMLFYQFGQGVNEICIRTITDNCPNGAEFCEQITVP